MSDEQNAEGRNVGLSAGLAVTPQELAAICDATVRLTEIRQRGCAWLCVENVAPEILRRLLLELVMAKNGLLRAEDIGLPTANA